MDTGLIPEETRKSVRTDFILVWPLLKSSPPIETFLIEAKSITPIIKRVRGFVG
jgi:hypothetical protein